MASSADLWQDGKVARGVDRVRNEGDVLAVYRGVELRRSAVRSIQRLIDERRWVTREEVAQKVCRRFRWLQGNGQWAVSSCRLLLLRLERRGLLCLPPPRRAGNFRHRRRAATHVLPTPAWLAAELSGALTVRPVTREEEAQWHSDMACYHYMGDVSLIGESLCYVAAIGEQRIAWLCWAAAALRNGPRDRYLGWDEDTRARRLRWVANNVRFLLLPGAEGQQLASRILGATLRRLSRDWQAVHGHRLLLAETFVDITRFRGTCYRASNWRYLGCTRGFSRRGSTYEANGRPKAVFVYPLQRHAQVWLRERNSPLDTLSTEGIRMIDVETLPLHGAGGLFEALEGVSDPRHRRGVRHPIGAVLAIAICAVLTGARSLAGIAQWSAELSREQLRHFGSRRRRGPSEPTIRRVLTRLDVPGLDRHLGAWVARHFLGEGSAVAIDGKTLRGSADGAKKAVHLVSAVLQQAGAVIAQHRVPEKTNEITSVAPLFAGLDLHGTVVSGDAMFAQKEIATHLVEVKGADYLFTVKDNQPTLRSELESLPREAFSPRAPHRR